MLLGALVAVLVFEGAFGAQEPVAHSGRIAGPSNGSARDALMEARRVAYDANFRNDKSGLHAAIGEFDRLTSDPDVADYACYYAGWTRWSLAASEFQDRDVAAARGSLDASVNNFRRALQLRPADAEVVTALANSLISIGGIDPTMWKELGSEIATLRREAIHLSPRNPRVVMMDAGLTFWSPAQNGGSQEKGVARWQEALRLFDDEKSADATDAIRPDWGRALAYGWLANLYLTMDPPRRSEAREVAMKALALRPDFWYVKTQIIPRVQ